MAQKKVTLKDFDSVKLEGETLYENDEFVRAIKVFLNGLEMADRYEQQWKHSLPL